MITRYQVWLGGEALHQLAPSICILDVCEQPPVMSVRTENRVQRPGQWLMQQQRRSLSISVQFAIREVRPDVRSQVLSAIHRWMKQGGAFVINTRPGQMLMVEPAQLPVCRSQEDWIETLTAVFTAYAQPFWQETACSAVSVDGSGAASLYVPGNAADTVCDFSAVNQGDTACQTLTITAENTHIAFTDLSLYPGETLYSVHEAQRLQLFIMDAQGNRRSAYHLRTAESHDELLLPCGQTGMLHVSTDGMLHTMVSARGCWL